MPSPLRLTMARSAKGRKGGSEARCCGSFVERRGLGGQSLPDSPGGAVSAARPGSGQDSLSWEPGPQVFTVLTNTSYMPPHSHTLPHTQTHVRVQKHYSSPEDFSHRAERHYLKVLQLLLLEGVHHLLQLAGGAAGICRGPLHAGLCLAPGVGSVGGGGLWPLDTILDHFRLFLWVSSPAPWTAPAKVVIAEKTVVKGAGTAWTGLLSSCVTPGKSLNLSQPQFLCLSAGDGNNTRFAGLLQELNSGHRPSYFWTRCSLHFQ